VEVTKSIKYDIIPTNGRKEEKRKVRECLHVKGGQVLTSQGLFLKICRKKKERDENKESKKKGKHLKCAKKKNNSDREFKEEVEEKLSVPKERFKWQRKSNFSRKG